MFLAIASIVNPLRCARVSSGSSSATSAPIRVWRSRFVSADPESPRSFNRSAFAVVGARYDGAYTFRYLPHVLPLDVGMLREFASELKADIERGYKPGHRLRVA